MLQAKTLTWGAALTMAILVSGAAIAQSSNPTAADVLFERRHLDSMPQGAEATYRLERKVSEPKLQGQPFSDDIKVKVNKVGAEGQREVALSVFTGDRARDVQTLPDLTGNPLLVLYLDRAVNNFSMLGGGARAYLKNQFRVALRETATIEPTKVAFDGKSFDGYRISVVPYINDRSKAKMQGFEGSKFSLTVSEQVPGHLVEMVGTYESAQPGTPKLEERITLVTVAGGAVAGSGAPQ